MFLNIVFLAGGICIGYLLRGEIDRRKSKKAWSVALEEGIKVAEKLVNDISSMKNDESEEDDDDNVVDFGSISNLIHVTESKSESNSRDETIQL